MNREQIIQKIRDYLAEYQPEGMSVEVLAEEAHQEGKWLLVPVRSRPKGERPYSYYEALSTRAEFLRTFRRNEFLRCRACGCLCFAQEYVRRQEFCAKHTRRNAL